VEIGTWNAAVITRVANRKRKNASRGLLIKSFITLQSEGDPTVSYSDKAKLIAALAGC
jgi:hypothetical protein